MLRKILVPLDGSEFSERALAPACELARQTGAGLALVRVIEVIAPGEREPGLVSYLDEHRIAEADDYIHRIASTTGLTDITAEAYVAADVATGIIARALDAGADTIVMTSHGRSWPATGLLGSVAARLLAESPVPVFLIGPRAGVIPAAPAKAAGISAT